MKHAFPFLSSLEQDFRKGSSLCPTLILSPGSKACRCSFPKECLGWRSGQGEMPSGLERSQNSGQQVARTTQISPKPMVEDQEIHSYRITEFQTRKLHLIFRPRQLRSERWNVPKVTEAAVKAELDFTSGSSASRGLARHSS